MAQFYTSNENDIRRCREALKDRMPITVTAVVGNEIKAFSGVVQSVDEDRQSKPPRWRVTMIDQD